MGGHVDLLPDHGRGWGSLVSDVPGFIYFSPKSKSRPLLCKNMVIRSPENALSSGQQGRWDCDRVGAVYTRSPPGSEPGKGSTPVSRGLHAQVVLLVKENSISHCFVSLTLSMEITHFQS